MAFIRRISITNWRTFGATANLELSYPDQDKAGLTVVVGRNNAGKSTVAQAFRMFVGHERNFSIPKSDRRSESGIRVERELVVGSTIRVMQSTAGASHQREGEPVQGLRVLGCEDPGLPHRRIPLDLLIISFGRSHRRVIHNSINVTIGHIKIPCRYFGILRRMSGRSGNSTEI